MTISIQSFDHTSLIQTKKQYSEAFASLLLEHLEEMFLSTAGAVLKAVLSPSM